MTTVTYDFVLVDVFSEHAFGGNQLAVLPDASGLSVEQMQAIAREFNFAETAFVLPAEGEAHTRRLRIFSPGAEMPFAGHPTVGAAAALAHLGVLPVKHGQAHVVFGERIGAVQARVSTEGGRLLSELLLQTEIEEPAHRPESAAIAATLGLSVSDVTGAWFGGAGPRFCFARLSSPERVDEAVLDKQVWSAAFKGAWADGLFFFAGDPTGAGSLYARMFAPGIGVDEDPATGSACAALAGHVAVHDPHPDASVTLNVVQGVKIGRRSEIAAGALKADGRVQHVTVAGNVTVVAEGRLFV